MHHSCSFRQKSKYIQSQELFLPTDFHPGSDKISDKKSDQPGILGPGRPFCDLIGFKKTLSVSNCSHADYSQVELSTNLTRG